MAKRDGLLKMLDDCEAGKIDFIIIKSISRFARNTTECLEADQLSDRFQLDFCRLWRWCSGMIDLDIVMENGEIVMEDDCKSLMVNEDVKKAYLGVN